MADSSMPEAGGLPASRPTLVVLVEDHDNIRTLTINREQVRNALNNDVLSAMAEAIQDARQYPELRAIIITGAGTSTFCAGGDLKPDSKTFGYDHAIPTTAYANMLRAAHGCDLPLIARVNGHCMAGGIGLLAMCDMAIASDAARFGLPEVKIGMFPMQVAALLQHMMPSRKFAELCITGEPFTAHEALDLGLINYITPLPELDKRVEWLVGRIIDKSPTAIRRGKYALRATRDMTIEQAIAFMENQIGVLALTEDSKEGISAFNERRPARWTGH
jgi:enoyl-CoA hydratase/carnithine racemase